jgi:DNA/RNA endonuclease YhcR with UshA esterase domain
MIRTLLFLTVLFPLTLGAQSLLFEENFNYSENTNLTDYGWVTHSGTGSPIQVVSPGLIYSGYPPSGVGNAVEIVGGSGSREDLNRQFPETNSGSVYTSFLVNMSSATNTGSYFLHLGHAQFSSTNYRARVFARTYTSNNLAFGITKSNTSDTVYTIPSFSLNTTYLIVMKYTFNTGGSSDDLVSLWINPDLSNSESSPDITQTDAGSDAENLGSVALRQGTDGPVLILDGIRIGTTWESLSDAVVNPPLISNINQTPAIPTSTDTVTISANVTDNGTLNSVKLFYSIASAAYDSTEMTLLSGDTYQSKIGPQPDGTSVVYYLKAVDDEGLTSTSTNNSYTVGSGPVIIPIADIKNNFPTYNGQTVTIQGIVTLGAGITITSRTDAYVQDNSGRGINIFSFDSPDPLLVRGNEVQITGTVTEFSGVIEIENYTIQLVSTGNPLPALLELTTQQANNINLEGTYIKINGNITAVEIFADATNLTVDDGSGDVLIRVWETTGIDISNLAVSDSVTITAVMDVFQSASQLTPGYQDEIVKFGTTPGDGSGIAAIFPDSVGISTAVIETIQLTGESPYTLESIQVNVPADWQWSGDVSLSGPGFSSAISDVQGNVINISSATVTDVNQGDIIIQNLISPSLNTISAFPLKTAVAGGSFTPISASPTVTVSSGGPLIVPIAEIKNNFSTYNGQIVTIQGVVTLGAGITITSRTDAYVQDNSGRGINIFSFDAPDPLLVRGNEVQITGTVTEFSGVIEIENYTMQLISTGNPLPATLELTTQQANNTALEGTYIKVNGNLLSIDVFSDAANLTVDDGSGGVLVRVWGTTGIDLSNVSVNDQVMISAVMDIFQSTSQLTPGYQDEIVKIEIQPGDGSGIATIDPDSVSLNDSGTETITISGESPYTLETIQVTIPADWQWPGSVSISGSGFSAASFYVQDKIITINSATVSANAPGIVAIQNLTSPSTNTISDFNVKTAVSGGVLTNISNSPQVVVGQGINIMPISDIRERIDDFLGTEVTIEGIVTLGSGKTISTRTDAYVQDNSGRGINIFSFDPPDPLLQRGNRVRVIGTVDEFSGVVEITNYSISLISFDNELPEPLVLSTQEANNIDLEGTYIQVVGTATAIDVFSDATNITVNDGSGELAVRVWGTTGINLGFLSEGDSVQVTAVMDIFSSQAQLTPGYQDEVIIPGEISQADGSGIATISFTTLAIGDTLSEISVIITGNVQDTVRKVQVDFPIFWQWSALEGDLQINNSGFIGASSKIELEDEIVHVTIENSWITPTDTGVVIFKNVQAPSDSINSVFWVKTAGEEGSLKFISQSPIVTVGGGDLYWIYDLQNNSANFSGNVTVRGVTTIGAGLLRQTSSGGTPLTTAYIQDQSGRGINLFRFGVLDSLILSRYNYVEAEGPVSEFESTTELEYERLVLLDTGFSLPVSVVLSNNEVNSLKWEGTYIQTYGVVADKFSAGGGTTIVISDGNGSTNIRIWDTANLDLSEIEINKALTVTGVGGIFLSNNVITYQILSVYEDQLVIDESYKPELKNAFLKVDAYPFVPDRGEEIGITYNAGAVNNQVTLRIFDLGGRQILTLLSEPATLVQNRVYWDGRNKLKDLVPLGTYICHMEVVEPISGDKKADTAPIVVGTILKK